MASVLSLVSYNVIFLLLELVAEGGIEPHAHPVMSR